MSQVCECATEEVMGKLDPTPVVSLKANETHKSNVAGFVLRVVLRSVPDACWDFFCSFRGLKGRYNEDGHETGLKREGRS